MQQEVPAREASVQTRERRMPTIGLAVFMSVYPADKGPYR